MVKGIDDGRPRDYIVGRIKPIIDEEQRMSKIRYFDNFKIVQLNDCIRECVKFYKGKNIVAILQKNGVVAIYGSGYFNVCPSIESKYKVACALYGLKLITEERLNSYKEDWELSEVKTTLAYLKLDAERLGYKLVKKQ